MELKQFELESDESCPTGVPSSCAQTHNWQVNCIIVKGLFLSETLQHSKSVFIRTNDRDV